MLIGIGTPRRFTAGNHETIVVSAGKLAATWHELNGATGERVDLVSFGNPHFSLSEIERLASLCRGRSKHPDVAVIVTTGRSTFERASALGLVGELEHFGINFIQDTCWCMIADPIIPPDARTIMTSSAKYAHYGPGLTRRAFYFGGMADCVDAACSTKRNDSLPAWLRDQSSTQR
jgi:predicted aconitase